jgi:hypothetical protein
VVVLLPGYLPTYTCPRTAYCFLFQSSVLLCFLQKNEFFSSACFCLFLGPFGK